ncbi:hypothetical protein, partial [Streptomyces sp. SID11385]|uniref:hypothetical protein n=1 Tax=Streptomyces sp. SID11385 TaxID=2706031 RepID=UPI0019439B3A
MTEPRTAQGHPCPGPHRPRRPLFPLAAALTGTMVLGVAGMTLGGAERVPGVGGGAGVRAAVGVTAGAGAGAGGGAATASVRGAAGPG